MLLANGAMAALLLLAVPDLEHWAAWGAAARAANLAMWVAAAAAVYVITLRLAGMDLADLFGRRKRARG